MIQVTIVRNAADNAILSFSIKGHAKYANLGQDIVCAGVSAVTIGTVNAAEKLLGIPICSGLRDGFASGDVPGSLEPALMEKLQLLLETMVLTLQSIEETYGKYIAIRTNTK